MHKRKENNGHVRKLKAVREAYPISLRELADKLNVHHTTVLYWETGKRLPDDNHQRKLEEFFNIPIETLLEEDEELMTKN